MSGKLHRLPYLSLYIFPLVFFILQILLKADYRWFFLSSHDPSYAFLFNGLNLARGSMEYGLAGFPGTTLHCLVALNLFVCGLFSGTSDIAELVLSDPEHYLNLISYEIVALNTMALIALGISIYKETKNLPLALALQLTPFISAKAFSFNSVIMLEPILLCLELCLIMLITAYTFGYAHSLRGKKLTGAAIFIALGVTTKIVFLPVLVLPLFAIEKKQDYLRYIIVMLVSVAVFLIPIYPSFSSFIMWGYNMFTHTGSYGTGAKDLFDLQIYTGNLLAVFFTNYLFTAVFFLLLITSLLSFFPGIKAFMNSRRRKMLHGLTLVITLNILMVAKHYSFHYLFVSYNLVVFGFILWLSLIPIDRLTRIPFFHSAISKVITIFLVGSLLLFILVQQIRFSPQLHDPRLKGLEFVKSSARTAPRIIVLEHSGPFIETALIHGFSYSAGMRSEYAPLLKKAFPASYFYNVNQGVFYDWINEYNLIYILSKSDSTYLYYYGADKDTLPPVLHKKLNDLAKDNLIEPIKTSYRDSGKNEFIYLIRSNTQKLAGKITGHDPVTCNFETWAKDTAFFTASENTCRFSSGHLRSSRTSFSGIYSVKLDKANPFGPGIKMLMKKGYYVITVMRKSNNADGLIVAANDSGTLYKTNAIADYKKDGWDSVRLTVDIPDNLIGQMMTIYLWYTGKKNCYFDDISITYFEVN